jgi:hypothetical protein
MLSSVVFLSSRVPDDNCFRIFDMNDLLRIFHNFFFFGGSGV